MAKPKQEIFLVACVNANGESDLAVVSVDAALHKKEGEAPASDAAIEKAKEQGYEGPFIAFGPSDQRNLRRALAEAEKTAGKKAEGRVLRLKLPVHASVAHLAGQGGEPTVAHVSISPVLAAEIKRLARLVVDNHLTEIWLDHYGPAWKHGKKPADTDISYLVVKRDNFYWTCYLDDSDSQYQTDEVDLAKLG